MIFRIIKYTDEVLYDLIFENPVTKKIQKIQEKGK